ncbi:neuroligin-2-like [Trichoplusia ni]|uniref:Neuroligin-2-like n=1 Tax=Trichoplusia ni TaxID=7111 RepID=A0A7E5WD55_TRINI|nr:neuroligin-2-like [Trichoplusia ni]
MVLENKLVEQMVNLSKCIDSTTKTMIRYSTRVVRTKYGPLRGIVVHSHPQVEAYLGVPYATPPLGSLRYMPPVTPSQWRTTRLADASGPACPQVPPAAVPRDDALLLHPRARIRQLERLLPVLANQSEDCLYVNLYVPVNGMFYHTQLHFCKILDFVVSARMASNLLCECVSSNTLLFFQIISFTDRALLC